MPSGPLTYVINFSVYPPAPSVPFGLSPLVFLVSGHYHHEFDSGIVPFLFLLCEEPFSKVGQKPEKELRQL